MQQHIESSNRLQPDGQASGGKIGLSGDVLGISLSRTVMQCSLQVMLKNKDDTQGRNQFPQQKHVTEFLIPPASKNLYGGWADNSHLPCYQLGPDTMFDSTTKAVTPSLFSLLRILFGIKIIITVYSQTINSL